MNKLENFRNDLAKEIRDKRSDGDRDGAKKILDYAKIVEYI